VSDMDHTVTLRRARAGDGAAICEIQIAAIRELGRSHYTQAEVDAWSGVHDGSLSPERSEGAVLESFTIVAEASGSIIAFGTLDDNGEVGAVYVRPEWTRQCIGSAVLSELLSEAGRRGLAHVCTKASLSGEAFYAQAGFEAQERRRHRFRSGEKIDYIWMVKQLESLDAGRSDERAPKGDI